MNLNCFVLLLTSHRFCQLDMSQIHCYPYPLFSLTFHWTASASTTMTVMIIFGKYCFNGFHLLKCEHMYCVERFKCPSSYCISMDHICNKVRDCPHCEDESICRKLLCPGLVLIEQMGSGFRCSQNVVALKHNMNYEYEASHSQEGLSCS